MDIHSSFKRMFDIIYSTDADREKLQKLQNAVPFVEDKVEQGKMLAEIEEIRARQKPLHECTLEECMELKTTVYNKFNRLQQAGKLGHAINFKRILVQVERRMNIIHQEMNMKEIERKRLAKESVKVVDEKSNKPNPKKESKPGASRWTTGIGKLD